MSTAPDKRRLAGKTRPVVYAAIPNYNMASELPRLLDSLQHQGYEHMYVLDDASTDNSREVVARYGSKVTFVQAARNGGAGAARNLILPLNLQGIVHFLDADTQLAGRGAAEAVLRAFARHSQAAIIGFRVRNQDGSQYLYNDFPYLRLVGNMPSNAARILTNRLGNERLRAAMAKLFGKQWRRWGTMADLRMGDTERLVEGVVECNMAIRLEDFAAAAGFAKEVRFHEIQDLMLKFKELGWEIWYVPEVPVVKHENIDVRDHRQKERRQSARQILWWKYTGHYKRFTPVNSPKSTPLKQNTLHVKDRGVE